MIETSIQQPPHFTYILGWNPAYKVGTGCSFQAIFYDNENSYPCWTSFTGQRYPEPIMWLEAGNGLFSMDACEPNKFVLVENVNTRKTVGRHIVNEYGVQIWQVDGRVFNLQPTFWVWRHLPDFPTKKYPLGEIVQEPKIICNRFDILDFDE